MGATLPPLRPGDSVDVIAPGSQTPLASLGEVTAFLESWGLCPRYPDDLLGEDPFYANSLEKRSAHLIKALHAPESRVLWCLQGGYGSTRLLEPLTHLSPPQEKYVLGFSDVTALHLYLTQAWGWRPIHGPLLGQLAKGRVDEETVKALHEALFKGQFPSIKGLIPLNRAAEKVDCLEAPLIGGNASLLQASLGTFWQVTTKAHFLFLEDVDEKPYRTLERLEHMRQGGVLTHAKAIFLFDFNFNTHDEDTDPHQKALYSKAFASFAQEVTPPVFKGSGVGHTRQNLPLKLGSVMRLENYALHPLDRYSQTV